MTGGDDPVHGGQPPAHPDAGLTDEYPTVAGTLAAPDASPAAAFEEPFAEDDEWLSTGPARGIRLGVPLAALIAVALVGAGFWGGAALEKSHNGGGSGATASAFAARFRAGRGGAGGFSFGGGGGGLAGGSGATTGTISVVAGNTLYVLSSTGSLLKVALTPSTTVTRNADAKPVELRPGDTVTIQGATAPNGTLTAASVAATAPGVSSATAGLGLGGAGAAGAGTTTTAGG